MLFKVTAAAITFALVNGNEDLINETNISNCVMHDKHIENQFSLDLEFEGYKSQERQNSELIDSNLSCAFQ